MFLYINNVKRVCVCALYKKWFSIRTAFLCCCSEYYLSGNARYSYWYVHNSAAGCNVTPPCSGYIISFEIDIIYPSHLLRKQSN